MGSRVVNYLIFCPLLLPTFAATMGKLLAKSYVTEAISPWLHYLDVTRLFLGVKGLHQNLRIPISDLPTIYYY